MASTDETKELATVPSTEKAPLKVADTISRGAIVIAVVGCLERFAYYGMTAPFQNYLQNRAHDPSVPGALGLGQTVATITTSTFSIMSRVIALFSAILADSYLGRRRVIFYAFILYALGSACIFATSLPQAIDAKAALPGFLVGLLFVGLGIAGVKSTVTTFIADQHHGMEPRTYERKGEMYITDRELTTRAVYHVYFWAINLSGVAIVITPLCEKYVGFWLAYLIPLVFLLSVFPLLAFARNKLVDLPIAPSALSMALSALIAHIKAPFTSHKSDSKVSDSSSEKSATEWSDVKKTLWACRIFLAYPFFWLCFDQMSTNLISQAAQMDSHGVPNDLLPFFNAIACLFLLPLFQKGIYPFLERRGITVSPIARITAGFLTTSIALAYAAGLQSWIYASQPCFTTYTEQCKEEFRNASPTASINLLVQVPVHLILSIAEVLASVTGSEVAYTAAPANMKSLVQALYVFTAAVGSMINIALGPLAQNPHLIIFYSVLAGTMFVVTVIVYCAFRRSD